MRQATSREREEAANLDGWWLFVKDSFVAPVSSGQVPARADYNKLPERFRSQARVIVKGALDLWDEGNRGAAQHLATEQFRALAADISPHREAPEADAIDFDAVGRIAARTGRG